MAVDYTLNNKNNYTLSNEQNEIVEVLLKNNSFFNCAQTGLGKTFATITAAVHKMDEYKKMGKELHVVLILPNSAVKAFVDTVSKNLGLKYSIYSATTSRHSKGARFHIFNYSTLSTAVGSADIEKNSYINHLIRIKNEHPDLWLILDEAHMLQDPNTKQYKLIKSISRIFNGMWFLTATPILNNLEGLFYMVDLLIPGFFGNIYAFRNRYMEYKDVYFYKKVYGKAKRITKKQAYGYRNLERLKEEFSKISIVRAKHYDIEFNYRSVELSKSMYAFYKMASAGLLSGKADNKNGRGSKQKEQKNYAPRLHDLQRVVSNSHKEFKVFDEKKITEKELLLIRTIEEVLNRNQAVLIYFSYLESLARVRYVLEYIKEKFGISKILEVSGKVTKKARKEVESQIDERSVVLITSAGTESINLQKANNLIFYEIPFSFREIIQASGRIARTGSEYEKFDIYFLEAEGTIDTYKKNRIFLNSSAIKVVLQGSNVLPTETLVLSDQDKDAMKEAYLWCK
jgi:SNF2 family DNA or RNA helicase